MAEYVRWYLSWLLWWAKDEAKETWRAMPGPWWVKLALVAACLAIPGPQDEIALIIVVRYLRKRRQRKMEAAAWT